MVAVVAREADLDGEMRPMGFEDTIRDVSGDRSGAFVRAGSASRLTAADLGLRDGERPLVSAVSAMRPTALGVGVTGGGAALALVRRFCGVDGAGADVDPASASTVAGATASAFRLRDFARGAAGGGIGGAADMLSAAIAPRRADLRAAILATVVRQDM